ncbi:hypothetical protein MNEG_11293 [Monoraphidium neglectum]|uniref:Uncharacterized protein n=1 Tax=Monoraphidium neglectum TaxID=145388 RepID=A0A0D2M652_9CHLO|nr:hypothetical protein MNEG_11293 [Monoraphidium neglectum]KIY96666.1 hypothetical protein MNEG_11293 [Monoraphidium neglectum]|eukprot:XP_013895686.1 hypothetical protein MNEG_11293 [Monoraphidium neglectum]
MHSYSRPFDRATALWNAVGTGIQPVLRAANAVIPAPARVAPRPPRLPRPPKPQPETSPQQLDAILARLDAAKQDWVRVGTEDRAELLGKCLQNAIDLAPQFAEASSAAKGSYEGGLGDEM